MVEVEPSETRPSPPHRMPLWVKVFGIVTLVLAVAFAILHLLGRGLGGHAH